MKRIKNKRSCSNDPSRCGFLKSMLLFLMLMFVNKASRRRYVLKTFDITTKC